MAYIPPHKRHSEYPLMPSPPPVMPVPKFNRNLNLGSPRHNADMGAKIVYADITAYRWLAVGSEDDTCFPSSVHLQPFSLEHAHPKRGAKSFVLANNNLAKGQWSAFFVFILICSTLVLDLCLVLTSVTLTFGFLVGR